MIESSNEICNMQKEKKKAWKKYKKSKGTETEQTRWKYFTWMRNRTKKLIKLRMIQHKRAAIKEIENLRIENPKEYWKKLKSLNGKKQRKNIWDSAIDEKGEEVTGDKIKLVWKEAYRKLGEKNIDAEEFQNEFAKDVDEEI